MMKYIVELTNFHIHIYNGYDITEAIEKAQRAGFCVTLHHVEGNVSKQMDEFSPISGWKYDVNH